MAHYRLFGRRGSGSLAPEMVLTALGQAYEMVPTSAEAARLDPYRQLCPTRIVPAMTLPSGETIFESAAICIHLTLAHPQEARGLVPATGTPQHAVFLQWMAYLATAVYGAYRRCYHTEDHTHGGEVEYALIRARAKEDLLEAYALLERALQTSGGPGLQGTLGVVDFYLFMLTTWYPGGMAQLYDEHPGLAGLAAAVRARPDFAALLAVEFA
ncbi:MAG: glutathione S-transferase family protein [Pseudomonadota bacterium]